MNKQQFMNILNNNLIKIPEQDRRDILFDYEEHFSIGLQEGRSEEDIANSLGNPKMIAKQVKANYMITMAENDASVHNIFRAIIASITLGFFNLVFILGPFIAAIGVLFAFFISGVAVAVSGFITLIASIMKPFNPELFNLPVHPVVGIFTAIGLVAFGLLWNIGTFYLSKWFYILTVQYLKLNLNIITNK